MKNKFIRKIISLSLIITSLTVISPALTQTAYAAAMSSGQTATAAAANNNPPPINIAIIKTITIIIILIYGLKPLQ